MLAAHLIWKGYGNVLSFFAQLVFSYKRKTEQELATAQKSILLKFCPDVTY